MDEVVEDAPWVVTQEFIDAHSIDFVAHDPAPYYGADGKDVYAFVKARGMFLPTRRTDGISTSDIILRIVADRKDYIRRCLDRGYSPRELNLGPLDTLAAYAPRLCTLLDPASLLPKRFQAPVRISAAFALAAAAFTAAKRVLPLFKKK